MQEPSELFNIGQIFRHPQPEQWGAQIAKETKNPAWAEALTIQTPEGIRIYPFYVESGNRLQEFGSEVGTISEKNSWRLAQTLDPTWPDAQRLLETFAAHGVEEVRIPVSDAGGHLELLKAFVRDMPSLPGRLVWVLDAAASQGLDLGTLSTASDRAEIWFSLPDDFSLALRQGKWAQSLAERFMALENNSVRLEVKIAPGLGESGASAAQELGYGLAMLAAQFQETGSQVSGLRWAWELEAGQPLFLETAKLRAARLLLARLRKAQPGLPEIELQARTSGLYLSAEQPHNNLVRQSMSALAAVMGGCKALEITPFDADTLIQDPAFALRMARNLQHLLRHECHLDAVRDPASGAYYLETLTAELAEKAWQLFESLDLGSQLKAEIASGSLQAEVQKTMAERAEAVRNGSQRLVGVNRYRAKTEARRTTQPEAPKGADFPALGPQRLAAFAG